MRTQTFPRFFAALCLWQTPNGDSLRLDVGYWVKAAIGRGRRQAGAALQSLFPGAVPGNSAHPGMPYRRRPPALRHAGGALEGNAKMTGESPHINTNVQKGII